MICVEQFNINAIFFVLVVQSLPNGMVELGEQSELPFSTPREHQHMQALVFLWTSGSVSTFSLVSYIGIYILSGDDSIVENSFTYRGTVSIL